MQADAGDTGGIPRVFDAGTEGLDGVESRQGIFGGEVVAYCDGFFGEERYEGGPMRNGFVGGDGELAA